MGFLIGKWWSMWIQRYWSTGVLEYRVVIAMVLLCLPDMFLKVIGSKFVFLF